MIDSDGWPSLLPGLLNFLPKSMFCQSEDEKGSMLYSYKFGFIIP